MPNREKTVSSAGAADAGIAIGPDGPGVSDPNGRSDGEALGAEMGLPVSAAMASKLTWGA